jgi:hypothetical protein
MSTLKTETNIGALAFKRDGCGLICPDCGGRVLEDRLFVPHCENSPDEAYWLVEPDAPPVSCGANRCRTCKHWMGVWEMPQARCSRLNLKTERNDACLDYRSQQHG